MKQLWINIQGTDGIETYKFHRKQPLYSKLRAELFGKYQDSTPVTITDSSGKIYDRLVLGDLFDKTK